VMTAEIAAARSRLDIVLGQAILGSGTKTSFVRQGRSV